MLSLAHVLYGVQPKTTRQTPTIPAHWQQFEFSEAVSDSREVSPDALFIALVGERTDGHRFLSDVAARGARGALVDATAAQQAITEHGEYHWALIDPATGQGLDVAPEDAFLLIAVDDPLMALQRLAAYHRRQLTLTLIGITGSVGKTSTKEVVAAVLSRTYRTLKSKRSFNSDVTVPTTLLSLSAEDEVAVLEMGMWAPGEIRFLASIAQPRIGIVTNVGPSHMERLGSIEAIANAKAELPESLPADGVAILNYDDERVRAMAERTQARVLFYGLDPAAHLWADEISSEGMGGISFRAHYGDEVMTLKLPLIGRHSVHTALAAIAAGLSVNMPWDDMVKGLIRGESQLRLLAVPGAHGSMLIDDTYNAAPTSTLAALNLLSELEGRRIAVLGDMLELGSYEEEAHRLVGRRVPDVADVLVAVGDRARWIAEEAEALGMTGDKLFVMQTNHEAIAVLLALLQRGDYVLVKGSRGVALEHIVAALQRQPHEEN